MKLIALIIITLTTGLNGIAQEEPSKNLPPFEMLPKEGEVKQIYELPEATEYKIYDDQGRLLIQNYGQFVDYSDFKEGVYFIAYFEVTKKFEKK